MYHNTQLKHWKKVNRKINKMYFFSFIFQVLKKVVNMTF